MQSRFEEYLIDLCAPTLAGIKVGSLFLYITEEDENLHAIINYWNQRLSSKGIRICIVKEREDGGLVYVFRPEMLKGLLNCQDITCFLDSRGFAACGNSEKCIEHLKSCFYNEPSFPHEIGIFLGYPLEDVKVFIEHKGRNSNLCGLWKVYGEPETAKKMFARYKNCFNIYKQRFAKGSDIHELTVAT